MPKRSRSLGGVQEKVGGGKRTGGRLGKLHEPRGGKDFREVLAAVCKYHCRGFSAG